MYRQTYSVSLNGEILGYTNNKVLLQKRINDYIKSGDGENVAFVELDNLPVYKACLLKKNVVLNDDEIFQKVANSGTAYYKYYTITANNEEKSYVQNFSDAEEVVKKLKDKDSENKNTLGIVEKYGVKDTSKEQFTIVNGDNPITLSSIDESVDKIYVKKKVVTTTSAYQKIATTIISGSSVKTDLGITLTQPCTGSISSRFGYRSRDNHKGLDIAAPKGTAIKAAAAGKVIFSGSGAPYSGYGNIVVVQSTDSVSIRYGHCSVLYVKTGEYVAQGQVIAAVGSTGISTGNHLHFEIRKNGSTINPQKYLYK